MEPSEVEYFEWDPASQTPPRELIEAELDSWDFYLRMMGRKLRGPMITEVYINGFKAAGIAAKHGKGKWNGRWAPDLAYAIEFPCPFDHPTADGRDIATVSLIVHEDGSLSRDPDSPCQACTEQVLEWWQINCDRCEVGQDDELHRAPHPIEEQWVWSDGTVRGSVAPFAFIHREFDKLARIAKAHWWVDHTTEAQAQLEEWNAGRIRRGETPFDVSPEAIAVQVSEASRFLSLIAQRAVVTKSRSNVLVIDAPKAAQTKEDAALWLDGLTDDEGNNLVPSSASSREAFRLVESLPNRPGHNVIELGQTIRRNRP